MFRRVLIVASIALMAAGCGPVRAQGRRGGAAPFDGSLQRLAEILGALHYLRGICGANEGQKWQGPMQSIIDAEAPAATGAPASSPTSIAVIAAFSRPTAPARPPPTWSSAAISRKAPRSPAR